MDQQSLQANLARMRAQATKKRGVQTMVCSTQADRPLQHTPAVGGGGGGAPPGALPFPTQHAQHLAEAPDETQGQEKIRKQLERVGIAPTVDATLEPFRRPDPVEMGRLDVTDTRSFLGQPPPRVGMIQCYIEREKAGNKYNFYLDERNVFLLAAVKRPKNKTSNYLISLDKDDLNRESGHFYGKLRANFVGTDFTIFDKGEKPGKEGVPTGVSTRQELGAILYERNILGTKGPRKMSVLLPAVDEGGKRSVWRPPREEVGMAAQFRKGNTADMMILKNKDPSWNEQLRAYVLNFQGRVKLASVKNFQLVDQDNPNKVLMQFGKVDTNRFIVDFQFPVCGLQAFAIALSAFDNKLACE